MSVGLPRHPRSGAWVRALVVGVVAGGAALAPVPSAAQQDPPRRGGTAVVAAEFEPATLNPVSFEAQSLWTRAILDPLLPDAYSVAPDGTFVPDVLEAEAIVTDDPFTVTYSIRDDAVWSDGIPVSAYDFRFTYKAHTNRRVVLADRTGYALITSAQIIDDKTITFTFRRPYPDYKALFDDVLPRHVLDDKNLNRAWRRRVSISAGPYQFSEWEQGSHLTLVRNPTYWGEQVPHLDSVVFTFIERPQNQVDALITGDVDVIFPTMHPSTASLHGAAGIEVQVAPGTLWEHLDFQLGRGPTRELFIREAIAYAVDREGIVAQLIRPIDPNAQVLQSLLFSIDHPRYEPHFGTYNHDAARAESILQANGCSRGDDGVYRCDGRRLALRYVTTKNNPIRRDVAEMIRADLADAGIELEVFRLSITDAFGNFLPVPSRWNLFNFAWERGTQPLFQVRIWRCDGIVNFTKYCDEQVDALLRSARDQTSPDERDALFDQADEIMAGDLPSLPLYQRPAVLAFDSGLDGLVVNPYEGPTWNIEEWARPQ